MPAEWETHDAVWMGWDDDSTAGFYPGIIALIKILTQNVTVKMAFNSDSLMQTAKAYLLRQGVDTLTIKFYIMPGERYWIRDHGASFLVNNKGELGVADFAWSSYGRPGFLKLKYEGNSDSVKKYYAPNNEKRLKTAAVDSLMAVAEGATILKTDVIHEGGAIEVNGKGTLILCEATVFQRNPEMKKEYMETEFKRVLGVSKIIWMKKGLADDPLLFYRRITGNYVGGGTGGHTDEFVRFANANTILLAWVNEEEKELNPVNKMNYERMSENLKILKQATDQDGKPFTIIKVPLPDLITKKIIARENYDSKFPLDIQPSNFIPSERPKEGDTLLRVPASSYMNYFVTNGLVILPAYMQMGSSAAKEEQVKQIFQEQFPGRKIVFFDFMPQNWDGGGIHCSTQQQPFKKEKTK
ncbi:MAG: agmatine deiminase family protein [Ferruginibacter sp.]|nr:agmatine deiminase family protein [Chitinophagaceae bacterium]